MCKFDARKSASGEVWQLSSGIGGFKVKGDNLLEEAKLMLFKRPSWEFYWGSGEQFFLNSRLRIFPTTVFGNSLTNSIDRGTL